jgi:tetratricopeptide (TPR) repeat protein
LFQAHRSIAVNLLRLGNFAEALEHFQRCVELQPAVLPETISSWITAAYVQERAAVLRGRLDDRGEMEKGVHKAIELNQHARTRAEQAWKTALNTTAPLRDIYICESNIMQSLQRLGDLRQALDYGRKAASHAADLITAGDPFLRSSVESSIPGVVLLAWQLGGEGADYTGILDPGAATPQGIRYHLAHGLYQRGLSLANDGLWQASMEAHQRSAELLEALLRDDPRNKDYRFTLARTERNIGEAYLSNAQRAGPQRGDLDQARIHFERARSIALELKAERLLPSSYANLPGQLASEIAGCKALAESADRNFR